MDIIRNKLIKTGFVLEKTGTGYFTEYVYKWQVSIYRHADYYVWITSYSNWHFKFEKAMSGHEKGIEGSDRHCVFKGFIYSLEDLEVLFRTTGVIDIIIKGENILKQ